MSFFSKLGKLVKVGRGPLGDIVTELIPDLVAAIKARRAAGDSDELIKTDIRSRLTDVELLRSKRDKEFFEKYGFWPDDPDGEPS